MLNRVAAIHRAHIEPEPSPLPSASVAVSAVTYAPVTFREPATAKGGLAYLAIGGSDTGLRPDGVTAVFVKQGMLTPEQEADADYLLTLDTPKGSAAIDADSVDVDVHTNGVTPGPWDCFAIASYPGL